MLRRTTCGDQPSNVKKRNQERLRTGASEQYEKNTDLLDVKLNVLDSSVEES